MKPLKTTAIFMIALFTVASMVGCKKSGSSGITKSISTSQLTFQLRATHLADSVVTPDTIAGLVWTAGTANVHRFMFDARRGGVNIEVESDSVPPINLFSPTTIPTYVTLDTGIYKSISVSVFLRHTSDTSVIPLKLTGTFLNDSSKTVPIELDLNSDVTLKVTMKDIEINGTTNYMALVQMALDKVTSGITANDLNKATVTNGEIVISRNSNYRLYDKIVDNLQRCGESRWWRRDRDDHNDHDWH